MLFKAQELYRLLFPVVVVAVVVVVVVAVVVVVVVGALRALFLFCINAF